MPDNDEILKYGLKENTIARINGVFAAVPEIERVILFGSRAMGTFRNGSDIDLTIRGDGVTHSQLLRMENQLDDLLLPHTIDLSLLHQIDNPDLLEHIRRVGVVFYERECLKDHESIIRIVLENYPDLQGIYLFGSYGTEDERPDSDVDIALLLPPSVSKIEPCLAMSRCCTELTQSLARDVDLVHVRQVSTVFQKEIITRGRLLHCADRYAVDEFEMLVLSYYQKLNEERREIMDAFMETGRAYAL